MNDLIDVIATELPRAVRWVGALARQLRRHDIAVGGKHSGSADTDALTLEFGRQELGTLFDNPVFTPLTGVSRENLVYCFAFTFGSAS